MKLRESISIAAPPEAVWPYVAIPQRMVEWNEKIVSVNRGYQTPVQLGERFEMTFAMTSRHTKTEVEVLECQPPEYLLYRFTNLHKGKPRYAELSFQLEAAGGTTHVWQSFDLSGVGIPWPIRLLIWFISRTGKTKGEPMLEGLRRLAEGNGSE